MPLLHDHQLRYVPVACFACGIVGVLGTFVLSAALPHWWFGMDIPQISITGYDPLPAYLLFCFGLSATGFLAAWTGVILYHWVEKVRAASGLTTHGLSNRAFRFLMIFAGLNLSALAWTDHRAFYKSGFILPHIATTLIAFSGWLVALRLNHKILLACARAARISGAQTSSSVVPSLVAMLDATLRKKRVGFAVLFVSMALHVPIGYIVPWFPLCENGSNCASALATCRPAIAPENCILFAECEALTGLTPEQCAFWQVEGNATLTLLNRPGSACSACRTLQPFMAVTQYMTIASLMALVSLFHFDLSMDPTHGLQLKAGQLSSTGTPSEWSTQNRGTHAASSTDVEGRS